MKIEKRRKRKKRTNDAPIGKGGFASALVTTRHLSHSIKEGSVECHVNILTESAASWKGISFPLQSKLPDEWKCRVQFGTDRQNKRSRQEMLSNKCLQRVGRASSRL